MITRRLKFADLTKQDMALVYRKPPIRGLMMPIEVPMPARDSPALQFG